MLVNWYQVLDIIITSAGIFLMLLSIIILFGF